MIETLISGTLVDVREISDQSITVEKRVDRETVVTGDLSGNVKLWRDKRVIFCTSELLLEEISAHTGPVVSLDVWGEQVASLDVTGVLCLWRISSKKLILREISTAPAGKVFRHVLFLDANSTTLLGGESGLRQGEEEISDRPVFRLSRLGRKTQVEYLSGELEIIGS